MQNITTLLHFAMISSGLSVGHAIRWEWYLTAAGFFKESFLPLLLRVTRKAD